MKMAFVLVGKIVRERDIERQKSRRMSDEVAHAINAAATQISMVP